MGMKRVARSSSSSTVSVLHFARRLGHRVDRRWPGPFVKSASAHLLHISQFTFVPGIHYVGQGVQSAVLQRRDTQSETTADGAKSSSVSRIMRTHSLIQRHRVS